MEKFDGKFCWNLSRSGRGRRSVIGTMMNLKEVPVQDQTSIYPQLK